MPRLHNLPGAGFDQSLSIPMHDWVLDRLARNVRVSKHAIESGTFQQGSVHLLDRLAGRWGLQPANSAIC
jgi:hypothetical protein